MQCNTLSPSPQPSTHKLISLSVCLAPGHAYHPAHWGLSFMRRSAPRLGYLVCPLGLNQCLAHSRYLFKTHQMKESTEAAIVQQQGQDLNPDQKSLQTVISTLLLIIDTMRPQFPHLLMGTISAPFCLRLVIVRFMTYSMSVC